MKKGFTLVELLCVIIIIAVVSVMVFPIVLGNINKSKDKLLKVQIKDVEAAAKKWALANLKDLDKYHINDIYVSISYLQDTSFLEKDVLLNPETKEEMTGCVLVKYNFKRKQYDYSYEDEIDCSVAFTPVSDAPYIVYANALLGPDKTHSAVPFYQRLLDPDGDGSLDIYADGEELPGIYDLEDAYVFRGGANEIRNHVTYAGHNWRILSISKDDYSIKLIGTARSGMWSSSAETDYANVEQFSDINLNNALVKKEWYNGTVRSGLSTIRDVTSALSSATIDKEIGLLSIADYASASYSCDENIFDGSCSRGNYLYTLFNHNSVWTMNTDGDKIWYINQNGALALEKSNVGNYALYPVIQIPVSVFVTNDGNGSESLKYELKSPSVGDAESNV